MMKIFAALILVLIAWLSYDIYFGRNGIVQYQSTEQKLQKASKLSEALEHRNQALVDEISDLKQGNKVVEELARSELGMVKKDETFYRVIEKDDKKKPSKK